MSDLLLEKERQERDWDAAPGSGLDAAGSRSRGSSHAGQSVANDGLNSFDEGNEPARSIASRES